MSEVGSVDSDVTHPESDAHVFITDDAIQVNSGYTFANDVYTAPPPPPPPTQAEIAASIQVVSMRQARLALLAAGHLGTVSAAIAAMTGPSGDAARIEWEFSNTVERNKPLVASMGTVLGMSESDLNNLFLAASLL